MLRIERERIGLPPLAALLMLALGLGLALLWSGQAVRAAGELEWKGRVEAMPATGLIGEWTIGGRAFVANSNTEFDTDEGEFAIGRCVEVEFVGTTAPFQATKLATKNGHDCRRPDGTPPSTRTPDPNGTPQATPSVTPTGDDDDSEARGIIESLPVTGLLGLWTISGTEYEITTATRLRQDGAPFVVGACVKVEYQTGTTPRLALRIEAKRGRDCTAPTPVPTGTVPPVGTPTATSTPDDDDEIYGQVESLPDGLIGEWVIGGQSYTATAATEFDDEHGDFAVGVCVKVHLESDGVTMREVEKSRGFRCGGSDDSGANAHGEIYGVIQSFPTDLIGDWNIGGITVVADSATEFKQRGGAFAVGVTVKVHFSVQSDGSFYAQEIETKFARDDHDDDDDHHHPGRGGHAFGTIERLPAELLGIWNISGISYTVNVTTTLIPTASNFTVGAQVRVMYYLNADQQRVARLIKLSNEDNGADDHSHSTLYGYVEQMPPSGFVGEWLVGGTSFLATGVTKFNETDGLLGLGAYVKMEYFVREGRNILHEIEVAVPPGAGDDTAIGVLEDNGGALQAAAAHATTWVIDGVSYTVTPATDLNEIQGMLTTGQTVLVNSYAATDGSLVATQISSIALENEIFLPLLSR